MNQSIQWLTLDQVLEINQGELNTQNKWDGLRDEGLLLSALHRPKHMLNYGKYTEIPSLSAVIAYGIIKNHPFIDGNKRTGFLASVTFLILNGFDFEASEQDSTQTMWNVADNTMDENSLTEWFHENSIHGGFPLGEVTLGPPNP